jgi:hypothetical protein
LHKLRIKTWPNSLDGGIPLSISWFQVSNFEKWQFFAKFVQIADSPSTQPDPSQPMSEYEELNCVYKSQIGANSLIYGAEIDGLKKREDLDNLFDAKMIELKTCRQNPNPYSFSK